MPKKKKKSQVVDPLPSFMPLASIDVLYVLPTGYVVIRGQSVNAKPGDSINKITGMSKITSV